MDAKSFKFSFMKKNSVFIISGVLLMLLFPSFLSAQENNRKVYSKDTEQEILLGRGDRSGMLQEPFSDWFEKEYESYQLNDSLIGILKGTHLSDMQVEIVMGTWCSDSKREVPRFYKVADAMHIPDSRIKVIYVDRDKKVPGEDPSKYNISKVPTFIFYIYGKEINRIIETPDGSFEKEMKNLCRIIHTKKFYKNQRAKWEGGNVY